MKKLLEEYTIILDISKLLFLDRPSENIALAADRVQALPTCLCMLYGWQIIYNVLFRRDCITFVFGRIRRAIEQIQRH